MGLKNTLVDFVDLYSERLARSDADREVYINHAKMFMRGFTKEYFKNLLATKVEKINKRGN